MYIYIYILYRLYYQILPDHTSYYCIFIFDKKVRGIVYLLKNFNAGVTKFEI